MTSPGATAADGNPPPDDPAARPHHRRVEPPAGQPISSGFTDPLTDDQRRDLSRRLAELFPFAAPDDFWAKEVRSHTPVPLPTTGTTDASTSPPTTGAEER